jgi:MFS family permease
MSAEAAAEDVQAGEPRPAPVSRGWIASLSLSMLGLWMGIFGPIQILIPRQVEHFTGPDGKTRGLALVTALAAVSAIIACPLGGALSDRTSGRFGRRRPWILAGALCCAAGLMAQSVQSSLAGLAVCWMIVQAGVNLMYAALSALIPDQVPVEQRGLLSALVGIPAPIALIAGTVLASTAGTVPGYTISAVSVVLLQIPFLVYGADPPAAGPPAPFRFGDFWISPRRHPDFAWVCAGRFAMQLGNGIGTFYLYFYLQDVLHVSKPEQSVATLIVIYTVSAVVISVLVGRWSDRVGRRKPFVMGGSLTMAAAVVVFALGRDWTAAILAGMVLGMGYGTFLALDNVLITLVLPAARSAAGKDLGVINVANTASQALSPVTAAAVVWLCGGSYTGLYFVTGGILLGGAFLIRPVRSVR